MKKAFTITEILIIISVIIIISLITIPITSHIKSKKYTITIEQVKEAFQKYISKFIYKHNKE